MRKVIAMVKLSGTEINVFYGHECYSLITGKEFCDCDECAEIRPKIYEQIWKEIKRNRKP